MAFSDKWTLLQLRDSCRRTLADPSARFWSNDELDNYIDEWQQTLQDQFDFVRGTYTATGTVASYTLDTLTPKPTCLDAVYWNGVRLPGVGDYRMDSLDRDWRAAPAGEPLRVVQDDSRSFTLWPAPSTSGTLRLEYPVVTTFTSTGAQMQIPAWTRYTCRHYVAWKALLREGPANNPNKAMRYKRKWERWNNRLRTLWANYFPRRYPTLKPGTAYEYGIVQARPSAGRAGYV